jgi:hypothetical protein
VRDLSARAGGIELSLAPAPVGNVSGRLVLTEGLSLRAGGVENQPADLEGTVTYDGTSIVLDPVTYESPQGRLDIRGAIESLWSSPRADLTIAGVVALSQLGQALPIDPPAQGTVALRATVAGPLAEPVTTFPFARRRGSRPRTSGSSH